MNKEDVYFTKYNPLKSLDKGCIISLWKVNDEEHTDVVIIPHNNSYTKNAYGNANQQIVGISSKTGDTYKENMGKNYKYKILKF